jgi:membrane associated rhomboid family serine protease
MSEEKKKFYKSLIVPCLFIAVIWIIKLSETVFEFSLQSYGIRPGSLSGLIGVLTSPLVHADYDHLLANTFPILLLGTGISYFYKNSFIKVFLIVYLLGGLLVWLFGRSANHIGASGLIYGFVAFLFFSGVIRRDIRAIALSLIVTFLYGSLIWGVLPLDQKISWESHLFGAVTGIICAFLFMKTDPYKKYDWEDETDTADPSKLEISYDNEYYNNEEK